MKTVKYTAIIAASVVIPIAVLYLMFAFILWDMRWASVCETDIRLIFVLLTFAALVGTVPMGCFVIGDIKDYEQRN